MMETLYCESGRKHGLRCTAAVRETGYSDYEFMQKADEFARVLFYRYHVEPGMRVGVLLYSDIEFLTSVYALNRLAADIVLCSTKCRREDAISLIKRENLDGLIFHKDFVQWFPVETEECFLICLGRSGICRLTGGRLLPKLPE